MSNRVHKLQGTVWQVGQAVVYGERLYQCAEYAEYDVTGYTTCRVRSGREDKMETMV